MKSTIISTCSFLILLDADIDNSSLFFLVLVVDFSFLIVYNIIAMISLDYTRVPILYIIVEENDTAASFLTFVESAVACGWIKQGDFLVLDNATIPIHSECEILPAMLWEAIGPNGNLLRINVLLLPTRSPEINPIELIFL